MTKPEIIKEVYKNRKKGVPGIVAGLAVIGGFVLANVAGTSVMYLRNMKKMKDNDASYKAMHSVMFGKNTITLGEDIQKAYITCMTGAASINIEEVPVNDDVYIDLTSVFGFVKISMPEGINVDFDGDSVCEILKNNISDYNDGEPTVHIIRRSFASKLEVTVHC